MRRARRYARKNRLEFSFDPTAGKGSHGRLTIGTRSTIVKYGEIGPNMLADILKHLGIVRGEF